MKPVEVRLVGRFRLSAKVQGTHQHLLYQAIHTQTDAPLFLKGEEIKNKPAPNFLSILQQGKILQTMQGGIGIPHMHWCGQQQDYNFIVLEELQTDFSNLLKKCGGKFSFKSVLMLGIQLTSILQYYHFKNFVHNHLNPKHFMLGAGEKYGKIYIVDYSNSIRYRDAQTLEHIAQNSQKKTQIRNINMQFSSIRYHKGLIPSRKDDLMSCMYMLLYFLKGALPWSHILDSKKSQNQKSKLILQMKQSMSTQQLFEGFIDLKTLYTYCQNLQFDQKPRYTYFKNIFSQRLEQKGYLDDKIYDWYLLEDEQEQQDIDLNFQLIPNEQQFIKQLGQEISAKQKADKASLEKKPATQAKKKGGKNDKDCIIY